ncbi:MAG: cell wall hydrolase [Caulobacteraceae bacterium]|nr:cell wall hydrolase [Caulobacteraceae bacterium]
MAQAADAHGKAERMARVAQAVAGQELATANAAPTASQAAASRIGTPASGKALAVTRVSTVAAVSAKPFHLAQNSNRDLDCLADAVYYEARGESVAGQAAIAQVVLNRVRHPAFPKSVCGVVFQGASTGDDCQFSFACDGSMRRPKDGAAWARAEQIAARALAGSVMPQVGEATHFHVAGLRTGWSPGLMQVAQVGLHVFYRFGGHAGRPSSFDGAVRPSAPDDATPHAVYASMLPGLGMSGDRAPAAPIAAAPAAPAAAQPAQSVASRVAVQAASPADRARPDAGASKPTQVASVS